MQPRPTRGAARGVLASALALAVSLAPTADAAALTWGTTRALTGTRNAVATNSLAVTTGNVLHAVFEEARGGVSSVRYRRSTNAGSSWTTAVPISTPAADYVYGAVVTGRGSALDAAWIEERDGENVLVYRRSTTAGASWSAPIDLTTITVTAEPASGPGDEAVAAEPPAVVVEEEAVVAAGDMTPTSGSVGRRSLAPRIDGAKAVAAGASPSYPRLVRDSSDRVLVTWTDDLTGAIYLRRSTDGGATFLAAQSMGTTTNDPFEGYLDAFPDVAAGTGIHYLVYYASPTSLKLRRSTNGGSTWTSAVTLASNGSGWIPDVAASGSSAVVGYAVYAGSYQYAVTRRTSDKGATWKSVVKLGSSTGYWTFQPLVIRGGSKWQAIYERCLNAACTSSGVYYRASGDGATWSTAVRISSSPRAYEAPGGLAYSDRLGVIYGDWAPPVLDSDVFFRAGS